MTTILALSNTNLNNGNLPLEVVKLAKTADLVLHAGNFTSQTTYDALNEVCNGKLWAVYGDRDPKDNNASLLMDSDDKPLGKKIIDDWNGVRIYLENNPCEPYPFSESSAMEIAEDNIADLLVFGNISQPLIMWGKKCEESARNQMLVCPGSSSIAPIYKSSFPSVAQVHINGNKISSVELVRIASINFQAGWRWCNKCQGLFFAPNAGKSKCPAGEKHDGGGGSFILAYNDPNAAGQANWRRCNICQCLFFSPNANKSKCYAGKKHDSFGSGNFTVIYNDPNAPGMANWRRCKKCQSLFFAPIVERSKCPAGEKHDSIGSGDYKVEWD